MCVPRDRYRESNSSLAWVSLPFVKTKHTHTTNGRILCYDLSSLSRIDMLTCCDTTDDKDRKVTGVPRSKQIVFTLAREREVQKIQFVLL